MGYQMCKLASEKYEDLFWHAAKLAEETGEVCQNICKRYQAEYIAEECVDVIHSAECILSKLGFTDDMLDELYRQEDEDCRLRSLAMTTEDEVLL